MQNLPFNNSSKPPPLRGAALPRRERSMRISSIIFMFSMLFAGTLGAQHRPATVTREIGQLIVALEQSGCEFYRNGSWHSSTQAGSHLRRKYGYLVKKDLISTAESFIDLAGTKSSLSGKPYLVRCPGVPVIHSNIWLAKALAGLRRASTGANHTQPKTLHGSARLDSGVSGHD